jgi:hypothetical protein
MRPKRFRRIHAGLQAPRAKLQAHDLGQRRKISFFAAAQLALMASEHLSLKANEI